MKNLTPTLSNEEREKRNLLDLTSREHSDRGVENRWE